MNVPTSIARLLADDYRRESAITRKVLRAYPADRASFTPHEHSNSAQQLAWTFVVENALIEGAMKHGLRERPDVGAMPDAWDATLDRYDAGVARVQAALDALDDAAMTRTVTFFTGPAEPGGPKRPAEFSLFDFVRFMLHDSIHHRGQLSVYLRLAGGKVPSIYGPSRDEPWT